ncbi:MAG TPA: hypothetical protein VLM79_21760 [Kofleriaceae bacterium]|nr:hypothetical protein [Kofleriaceae bacterium]
MKKTNRSPRSIQTFEHETTKSSFARTGSDEAERAARRMAQMSVAPLHFLLLVFAGWVNRRRVEVLEYLQEENRILREQLGDRRLRFTDAQRRSLAMKGRAIGRRALEQLAGLVTPDTIMRWYRELIAKKYVGSSRRKGGRRGAPASLHRLVVRFATENATWG